MTTTCVATVKGGLFAQYGSSHSGITNIHSGRRQAARILFRTRGIRALMAALNGVAPGATASIAHGQIQASTEQGGKRIVETVYPMNRATVAGDVTEIAADVLTYTGHVASPPKNKDANPLNNAGER